MLQLVDTLVPPVENYGCRKFSFQPNDFFEQLLAIELKLSSRSGIENGSFRKDKQEQLTRRLVMANSFVSIDQYQAETGNQPRASNRLEAESEYEEGNDDLPASRVQSQETVGASGLFRHRIGCQV